MQTQIVKFNKYKAGKIPVFYIYVRSTSKTERYYHIPFHVCCVCKHLSGITDMLRKGYTTSLILHLQFRNIWMPYYVHNEIHIPVFDITSILKYYYIVP